MSPFEDCCPAPLRLTLTEPPSPGGGAGERTRASAGVMVAAGASLVLSLSPPDNSGYHYSRFSEAALTTWPQAVSCGAQTPKQPRLDPQPQSPPRPSVGAGGGQMPPSEQPAQLPTDDFLMLPVTWIFIT